jgi:hypothetical protein
MSVPFGGLLARRLSKEFGLPSITARSLIGHLHARVGTRRLAWLAVPYLVATLPGLERALPRAVRRRARRPLLVHSLEDLASVLCFLGVASTVEQAPCGGLLTP